MQFPSSTIENAVNELSKLPGIGKKSALRFALFLLKSDYAQVERISEAILDLKKKTVFCSVCHNISNSEVCNICASPKREKSIVCVVEDVRDVLAIENTNQYFGVYHVLGGVISPLEGISPNNLNLDSLIQKVSTGAIKELILALSSTMEGDTTAFYIAKKVKDFNVKLTTIARGIPMGGELEFTDEITLGRSIIKRVEFN
ncbi:MAG TPA: recombination mediator RecR [Cytophagales bacterium]|nr:recombination mediator RecR [Cytophagales bacterium]